MDSIKKKTPKALIIIGNGFDVAHGLKTKYSDFYSKSNELEELSRNGNLLCQHILRNIKSELWKDLELGLYDYSVSLTETHGINNKESSERFRQEFLELKSCLFTYIRKAINEEVYGNPGRVVADLSKEWQRLNYHILSFNYSYVVAAYTQEARKKNEDYIFNEKEIIFQHGSLYNGEQQRFNTADSIVLGIDESQKVEKSHSFLYKSLQSVHNINDYLRLVESNDLYVVYGCSMGASDAFYYNQLFNKKHRNKTFVIYGYGEEELKLLKEAIFNYTGGMNSYIAETNNVFVFIDSHSPNLLLETRSMIDEYVVKSSSY